MDKELRGLRHSKNETDRRKAIGLLQLYLDKNSKDVEAWYAKATCHDFIGEEKEAQACYQQVYDLGWNQLSEKEQRSFFVGFGSTLRNNLQFEKSVQILEEAIQKFPDYPALKAFVAFSHYSLKNDRRAAQVLFQALLDGAKHGFDGYEKAIAWYSESLDSHPQLRK